MSQATSVNLKPSMFRYEKFQINAGDNTDKIYFTIKSTDLKTYDDVRSNFQLDYLVSISCQYVVRNADNFNWNVYNQQVETFDINRKASLDDRDFRLLYDGFSVPTYKFNFDFNINTRLKLPENVKLLMSKAGIELMLYVFIYTLVFGYNYISLNDIIEYVLPFTNSEIYFKNITIQFFNNVMPRVKQLKDNFPFFKDYMNKLKTQISELDLARKNIMKYLKNTLNDQNYYKDKTPFNRKQEFIFSAKEAKNSVVYFLGDIEGDYLMILNWFIDNDLIDRSLNWIANSNVYVFQCGDQLDKNNLDNNSIKNFRRERGQSIRRPDINVILLFDYLYYVSNGQVVSVIGNHDFASIQKDYRFISRDDFRFRNPDLFQRGKFLYEVIMARPFIVVFNNFVISHAGLTEAIVNKYCELLGQKNTSLTEFATTVNNFDFYNKDLNLDSHEEKNLQYLYKDKMFMKVINELMWNRVNEKVCHNLSFKVNTDDSSESPIINVLGHNPFETVNYCYRDYSLKIGGSHIVSDLSAIKVDTGITSRKCKDFAEINYAVLDSKSGVVQTKSYLYDCDKFNANGLKFDINFYEILFFKNKYDFYSE